ncbi:hypothetical protein ID866_5420 [Astraeus odoratus]|nr:hypothetical protein ID866_5420 [Astraeus odoratus]
MDGASTKGHLARAGMDPRECLHGAVWGEPGVVW